MFTISANPNKRALIVGSLLILLWRPIISLALTALRTLAKAIPRPFVSRSRPRALPKNLGGRQAISSRIRGVFARPNVQVRWRENIRDIVSLLEFICENYYLNRTERDFRGVDFILGQSSSTTDRGNATNSVVPPVASPTAPTPEPPRIPSPPRSFLTLPNSNLRPPQSSSTSDGRSSTNPVAPPPAAPSPGPAPERRSSPPRSFSTFTNSNLRPAHSSSTSDGRSSTNPVAPPPITRSPGLAPNRRSSPPRSFLTIASSNSTSAQSSSTSNRGDLARRLEPSGIHRSPAALARPQPLPRKSLLLTLLSHHIACYS